MIEKAAPRCFFLHKASPQSHICFWECDCEYSSLKDFRDAATSHITARLQAEVDTSGIQIQVFWSSHPLESSEQVLKAANADADKFTPINDDVTLKFLGVGEDSGTLIVVISLCFRLRLLARGDDSPSGYINVRELNILPWNTAQIVEEDAHRQVTSWYGPGTVADEVHVLRPNTSFVFNPGATIPAEKECTRLQGNIVVGRGDLIINPLVHARFLILTDLSPRGEFLGNKDITAPVWQTVRIVEDVARGAVMSRQGLDYTMSVWQPRVPFDITCSTIPEVRDFVKLNSNEKLGAISNRTSLVVTPILSINFLILDNGKRVMDGKVSGFLTDSVKIVVGAARTSNKLRSNTHFDLEVWQPRAPFDIKKDPVPPIDECDMLSSDTTLAEITNQCCLIVPVFNLKVVLIEVQKPDSCTLIGCKNVSAPFHELVQFVEGFGREAFNNTPQVTRCDSTAELEMEVTVYQPKDNSRDKYKEMVTSPDGLRLTLFNRDPRSRTYFSPCIPSSRLRDLGCIDFIVALEIKLALFFPFVVLEGGPQGYRYVSWGRHRALTGQTVESLYAHAKKKSAILHQSSQSDVRVYEPTKEFPELYDKEPQELEGLSLTEERLEAISRLDHFRSLMELHPKQTLILVFSLVDKAESRYRAMYNRYHAFLKHVKSLTPSKSAQSTEFAKRQGGSDTAIFDGSYVTHQNRIKAVTVAPPLQIYHPVFQLFENEVKNNSRLDSKIVDLVSKLVSSIGEIQAEKDGAANLRGLFAEILNRPMKQVVTESRYTDGLVSLDGEFGTIPTVIFEYKCSLGDGGCDPLVQASYSTLNYWSDTKAKSIRDRCCCPSFIIAGSGAYLAILGVVFTDRFIVQRLTDLMWCGEDTMYGDSRVSSLARVFTALSLALNSLESYYQKLEKTPQPSLTSSTPHPRFFPYPRSFNEDGVTTSFEYCFPLKDSSTNVTFFAKTTDKPVRKLVIKFVGRYSTKPHRHLADNGMAPKLFFCGSLDGETQNEDQGDDPSGLYLGPLRMVVMDWVEGETAEGTEREDWPKDTYDQVHKALLALHEENFVFGDLRGPNVMFNKETKRVFLIDFDWSGPEGTVRYPRHLSKQVDWPGGVGDGIKIAYSHDLDMLRKLVK